MNFIQMAADLASAKISYSTKYKTHFAQEAGKKSIFEAVMDIEDETDRNTAVENLIAILDSATTRTVNFLETILKSDQISDNVKIEAIKFLGDIFRKEAIDALRDVSSGDHKISDLLKRSETWQILKALPLRFTYAETYYRDAESCFKAEELKTIFENKDFIKLTGHMTNNANKLSIARSALLTLERFDLGLTDKNIALAARIIIGVRNSYKDKDIVGALSNVMILNDGRHEFDPMNIKKFFQKYTDNPISIFEGFNVSVLEEIKTLPYNENNNILYFDHHGDGDVIGDARGKEVINYTKFSKAFIERAKNLHGDSKGKLSDMIIIIDTCLSSNFAVGVYNELTAALKDGTVKDLPVIIASSNRDTESKSFGSSSRYYSRFLMSLILSVSDENSTSYKYSDLYNSEQFAAPLQDTSIFLPVSNKNFEKARDAKSLDGDASKAPNTKLDRDVPVFEADVILPESQGSLGINPWDPILFLGIGSSIGTIAKGVQPVYDASGLAPARKAETKETADALASGETIDATAMVKAFNKEHKGALRIELSDIVGKQITPEVFTNILLQVTDKAKYGHLYDAASDLEADYNVTLPKTKGLAEIVIHIDFDNTPKGQWSVLNRENVISINLAKTGYSSEDNYYNASMEARNWLYEKLVSEIEKPVIDAERKLSVMSDIDAFNTEHEGDATINITENIFVEGRDFDHDAFAELIANIKEENKSLPFTVDGEVIKGSYNFNIEKKQGLTDIEISLEHDAAGKWVTRRENEVIYVNLARIDISKRSHSNAIGEAIYQARKSLRSDITSRIRKIGEIKGYWEDESIEDITITAKELSEIDAVYETAAGSVVGEIGESSKKKDFREYETKKQIEDASEAYDEGESIGEFYSRIKEKLFGDGVSGQRKLVYAVLAIAAVGIGFVVGLEAFPWLSKIFANLSEVSDEAPVHLAKVFISSIFVALATGIVVFINKHESIRRSPIAKIIYGSMGLVFIFLAPSALKAFSPDGPAGTPFQPELPQMPTFDGDSPDVPAPFASSEAYIEYTSKKIEVSKVAPASQTTPQDFEFDPALDGDYTIPVQAEYNQHLVDDEDSGILQRATKGDKRESPYAVMDFRYDYKGMVDGFERGEIVFVTSAGRISYEPGEPGLRYEYSDWFRNGNFEIEDARTGETLHSISQWDRRGRVFAYSSDGNIKLTSAKVLEYEEKMKEIRTVIIPLGIPIDDSTVETLDSALEVGGHEIVGGENAAELKIKRAKEASKLTQDLEGIKEKLYLEKTIINDQDFNGKKLAIYHKDGNVSRVICMPDPDKDEVQVWDYAAGQWTQDDNTEKEIAENEDYVRYRNKDMIDRAMTYINLSSEFAVRSGYDKKQGMQYKVVPEIELAGRQPIEIFVKGTDTVIEINSEYARKQAEKDLDEV
ncbi:MAG: hypothetical protein H8D54_01020, partial [Candidatus Omnitrophica bacterium]|nr:hypothetical protein [Candidatus Omnitrophota bacterium]